jgi:hypothetical protein
MKHTPYGYVIVGGRPQVNELQAARLSSLYSAFLLGMPYEKAAEFAGIRAGHSMVGKLLCNRRYLGDDVYPQIIDDDIFNAVQKERLKRMKKHGTHRNPPKQKPSPIIFTDFHLKRINQKFTDPIAQAEYAYGRIEGKVIK